MSYRARAADFGGFLVATARKIKYLIGTRGQIITHSLIRDRLSDSQYHNYHDNIRKYGYQNVGEIGADCLGWLEMFWNGGSLTRPLTKWIYPDITTSMVLDLVKKLGLPTGPISTLPKNCPYPLAVCYPGHVGFFYLGKVYQSAGHAVGTIITDLTDTRYNKQWKYWYMIPWLDYEGWNPNSEEDEEMIKNPYPEPTKTYPAGQTFRGSDAQWFIWELLQRGHNLVATSDIAGQNTWAAIFREQEKAGIQVGDADEMTRMMLKGESGVSAILALQAENKQLKAMISAAQAALKLN